MSCYEEERGSYRLPKVEVRRFRDAIIERRNQELEHLFQAAQLVKTSFNGTSLKARREITRSPEGVDTLVGFTAELLASGMSGDHVQMTLVNLMTSFNAALQNAQNGALNFVYVPDIIDQKLPRHRDAYRRFETDTGFVSHTIVHSLVNQMSDGQQSGITRLKAPQKKILNDFKIKKTDKSIHMHNSHCELVLNIDDGIVRWDVERNNHAVDDARASTIGKLFFKLLRDVKWTRGTGGEIQYRSEYTDESSLEPEIRDVMNPQTQKDDEKLRARGYVNAYRSGSYCG